MASGEGSGAGTSGAGTATRASAAGGGDCPGSDGSEGKDGVFVTTTTPCQVKDNLSTSPDGMTKAETAVRPQPKSVRPQPKRWMRKLFIQRPRSER